MQHNIHRQQHKQLQKQPVFLPLSRLVVSKQALLGGCFCRSIREHWTTIYVKKMPWLKNYETIRMLSKLLLRIKRMPGGTVPRWAEKCLLECQNQIGWSCFRLPPHKQTHTYRRSMLFGCCWQTQQSLLSIAATRAQIQLLAFMGFYRFDWPIMLPPPLPHSRSSSFFIYPFLFQFVHCSFTAD